MGAVEAVDEALAASHPFAICRRWRGHWRTVARCDACGYVVTIAERGTPDMLARARAGALAAMHWQAVQACWQREAADMT